MCGIFGYLSKRERKLSSDIIKNIKLSLRHRGPDDHGHWVCPRRKIVLGHTRLSILDLSEHGRQPMSSPSGRYIITYNGEIYNYKEIELDLYKKTGFKAKTQTDTEIILASIEIQGIEKTLEACNGMFAFAVWDQEKENLILARDRIGIKPLYYYFNSSDLFFSSELKAFKQNPHLNLEINERSIQSLLQKSYIQSPQTIYKNTFKLPPGTYSVFSCRDNQIKKTGTHYWSLDKIIYQAKQFSIIGSKENTINSLREVLLDSVKLRLRADVPVGAFLSGGIDSSLIVALAQSLLDHPIRTYSIGFDENGFNEAPFAKQISKHLGTIHTECYLRSSDILELIPNVVSSFDEPFADSSQLPTYLVAKLAAKDLKVCLSGDGGDELFSGYTRYFLGEKIWNKMKFIPFRFRLILPKIMRKIPPYQFDRLISKLKSLGISFRYLKSETIYRLLHLLESRSFDNFYNNLITVSPPSHLVLKESLIEANDSHLSHSSDLSQTEKMMFSDTLDYLPNDILTKVDRATMSHSLEARVPFLDHRVLEKAWGIPLNMKVSGGEGKIILKELLYQYVPKKLLDRPKMGFGIPLAEWLRGDLKNWAEDLLYSSKMKGSDFFDEKKIDKLWKEHLSKKKNCHYQLWPIIMFKAWCEKNK